MKKATLLKYLFLGYQENMERKEYEDLKNSILQHEKDINAENATALAESILKNYPQFEIMHEAFMRARINEISSRVNTIKTIMVILVIASVISAIAIASQIK
jgi:hypothetical protein